MNKYLQSWFEIRNIVREFITTPNLYKAFLYGIALYAIALFALLRGDIYYLDDWGSSSRETTWNHFSRYLTTFMLNNLVSFGKSSIDSSPLLQIIAVIFIIASALILLYLIRGKFDFIGIVASLPLGFSPYFLENLSYKFESLTMSMALFFAIVPFLFKEKIRIFCAISVVSLIFMFMTYQAANATYIILSLYFAFSAFFIKRRNFKESVLFLGICAINLIVATLIYKFIIAEPINTYTTTYTSDKIIALDSHFFIGIWANLSTYATTIFNDFKQTPYIWLILLNCCLFVANISICANRPKIALILGATLFLMLGFALSFGLYLVLQKPIFTPRAFYGFNAFVAVIAIANVSFMLAKSLPTHATKYILSAPPHLPKILHYISCVVAVVTAYFLISFANIYGNAINKQDEYWDFRTKLLLSDLGKVVPRGASVMISIENLANSNHPVAQRFAEKYGGISRLIPSGEINTHLLGGYESAMMLGEFCNNAKGQSSGEILLKNAYHTIKRVKLCYIVTIR